MAKSREDVMSSIEAAARNKAGSWGAGVVFESKGSLSSWFSSLRHPAEPAPVNAGQVLAAEPDAHSQSVQRMSNGGISQERLALMRESRLMQKGSSPKTWKL